MTRDEAAAVARIIAVYGGGSDEKFDLFHALFEACPRPDWIDLVAEAPIERIAGMPVPNRAIAITAMVGTASDPATRRGDTT